MLAPGGFPGGVSEPWLPGGSLERDTGVAWADMTTLQQRELTAHFVSGWTRDRLTRTLQLMREGALPVDRLVGQVASSDAEAVSLMTRVVAGELGPTAGAIDWSSLR